MNGIASFKPGFWNGEKYDAAFVRQLHDNFQRLSTGPKPLYRPYVSINHNDAFRFGGIVSARMDGPMLVLDADEIPVEIGQAVNTGMLKEPSIEFVKPKRGPNGSPVSGFTDAAGKIVDGPVIKCLTFLGPDLPGVKGLPPLPAAVFRHFGGIVSRFGSKIMDRAGMIQFLQEQGLDTSGITETVPDSLLQAVVALVQKMTGANPNGGTTQPNPNDNQVPTPSMMADIVSGLTGGAVAGTQNGGAAAGAGTPSQVVVKFVQLVTGLQGQLGQLATGLKRIEGQSNTVTAAQTRILNGMRDTAVTAFLDEMAASGQIPAEGKDKDGKVIPGMRSTVRAMLEKCDTFTVRKFSADPTRTGTEFEETCDTIRRTYPVVRKFGHQTTQPDVKVPATRTGTGGGLDPERRKRILGGSPLGQTVLNKQ